MPSSQGTDFITTVILSPILDKNANEIDNTLNRVIAALFEKIKEGLNRLIDTIPNLIRLGNQINAEKLE